jgi:hypothetical protein
LSSSSSPNGGNVDREIRLHDEHSSHASTPWRFATVERLCQLKREPLFADTSFAGEEERPGQPTSGQQPPERLFYFVVADEVENMMRKRAKS